MARARTGIVIGNISLSFLSHQGAKDNPFHLEVDDGDNEVIAALDFEDMDAIVAWYKSLPRPPKAD